ncbi:MAG: 2,3,4,5-tetrahydropyridine-2,6-dicarboxylate N-succinyltransferase [Planctomycetes bacterium]|jgi:2,3,4,5-tetrahydropyridine-2-carboxylate N-succinyltransferase|nr:2,3,4,5-tetrahydropyridine-2,6-dicarboxylate N-succinyltransferase [Planctomycetota bacterium]MDP6409451.1 2,3,4,5-tetrahydropyridine-2,6-dicarboxylate N-succinyltransferase [Planctomycetota bacterium]
MVDGDRPRGAALLDALERGELRVASPDGAGGWTVHAWIKLAILELFRESEVCAMGLESEWPGGAAAPFRDKSPLRVRRFTEADGVRIVPGGSAVRRGAHLGRGVVCMPPMYVNVGAFVGERTMIDSHALIGSCAQVGSDVHVSAGAQIGGVLEPPAARPVIVEDGAFVGGNVGLYEGVSVGREAVIAAGVVLSATTPVFDLVGERTLRGTREHPLAIPARSVVVPGTRPARGGWAEGEGLQQACGLIVKRRDAGTAAATALENALR